MSTSIFYDKLFFRELLPPNVVSKYYDKEGNEAVDKVTKLLLLTLCYWNNNFATVLRLNM